MTSPFLVNSARRFIATTDFPVPGPPLTIITFLLFTVDSLADLIADSKTNFCVSLARLVLEEA